MIIEFKHTKSNFYVYLKGKKLITQLSAGVIPGYNDKSSKRQKIKHLAEQLAEVSSVKANRFKPNLLESSPILYKLYKKLGLINNFFSILTRKNIRLKYARFIRSKRMKRDLKNFPPFSSLHRIAVTKFQFGYTKLSRSGKRYARLSKKYKKVYRKKFVLNDRTAKKTFYKYIYKRKLRRVKRLRLFRFR